MANRPIVPTPNRPPPTQPPPPSTIEDDQYPLLDSGVLTLVQMPQIDPNPPQGLVPKRPLTPLNTDPSPSPSSQRTNRRLERNPPPASSSEGACAPDDRNADEDSFTGTTLDDFDDAVAPEAPTPDPAEYDLNLDDVPPLQVQMPYPPCPPEIVVRLRDSAFRHRAFTVVLQSIGLGVSRLSEPDRASLRTRVNVVFDTVTDDAYMLRGLYQRFSDLSGGVWSSTKRRDMIAALIVTSALSSWLTDDLIPRNAGV